MTGFTDGRFYAKDRTLCKAPFHRRTDDGKTQISMGFEVATLSDWVDPDFAAEIAACLNAHDELVAALLAQEELASLRMPGDMAENISRVRAQRRAALAKAEAP